MRRNLIICLLLVVTTMTVYGQVMRFEFVNYDDQRFVTENEHVQEGLTARGIAWAFTGHVDYWRPVSMLSHMLDCQLYGLKPAGHHLTNLVLHLINTLLLFGLLKSMTRALWPSAAVAALFCLHPLHVEAVAWVAERKEVLSATFSLLSAWAYVAYTRRGGVGRYLLTALFLAMGLMAKPMIVTLPALFVLLDYWPLERIRVGPAPTGRRDARRPITALLAEKIPLLILCAASGILTILNQKQVGALGSTAEVPMHLRAANALVSYVRYLGKTIWPKDLSVLYPHPNLPGGTPWQPWQVVGAGLALLVISALVVIAARRRYLLVGWLWFLGTLLPVIGLAQVGEQAIADRYTYVPLIGVFIIIAWAGAEVVNRWRHRHGVLRPATALAAAITLTACAAWSWSEARYWRNSESLYRHALDVTPDNPTILNNLGSELVSRKSFSEAIRRLRQSLQIKPDNAAAHSNLGYALASQGQLDTAIDHLKQALRIKPDSIPTLNNMGWVLGLQNKPDEAIGHLERALQINPRYYQAHFNLGQVLVSQGQMDQAIDQYRQGLHIKADDADAHYNLGVALQSQSEPDQAISHLRQALQIRPDHGMAHADLAITLASLGRFDEAISHFQQAVQLRPDDTESLYNLGQVNQLSDQLDEAISHYREVIRIKPNHADAQFKLGSALATRGAADEALAPLGEALRLRPDYTAALNLMAWILATHPDAAVRNAEAAIQHAQRASRLTDDRSPPILDTLAAAYAEAGRFDDAVRTAQSAVELAAATGDEPLTEQFRRHLELYRHQRPYREPPPGAPGGAGHGAVNGLEEQ